MPHFGVLFLQNTDTGACPTQPLSLSPFPSFFTQEGNAKTKTDIPKLIKSLATIDEHQVSAPVSEFETIWTQPRFPPGCLMRCWPQSSSCDVFYKVDDAHMVGFACKSATSQNTAYGVNVLIDELEKGFISRENFPSCKRQIIVAVFLSLQKDLSDLERYNDAERPSSISWAQFGTEPTQSQRFELVSDERGKVTAFRFKPDFKFHTSTRTKGENKKSFTVPDYGEVFLFTDAGMEQFFGDQLLELLRSRGAERPRFQVAFRSESVRK